MKTKKALMTELFPKALTADNYGQAFDLLARVKVWVKNAEGTLKDYAERNGGHVPTSDGRSIGFAEKSMREIKDVEAAFIALQAAGVDETAIWEALSLPVGKAEKLVKGMEADLSWLIEYKQTKTFGVIKGSEKEDTSWLVGG